MTFLKDLAAADAALESRPKFTTILKVGVTSQGQYCVGKNAKPIDGWLDRQQILDVLPKIQFAPVGAEDPFFIAVGGRQRLVLNLEPESWFYQQTMAPFALQTQDPARNFKDVTMLYDDPYDLGRSKTLYLTDENKKAGPQFFHYDLLMEIWQDPSDIDSARTPTVIDPGLKNDQDP